MYMDLFLNTNSDSSIVEPEDVVYLMICVQLVRDSSVDSISFILPLPSRVRDQM